ncbi:hypothetical protein FOA52_015477 [Chlamydomonas sp. UWO 241]|nr:hypothetical protein FOA52_015477 [Chlamydomonas sp. UWO 241]
MRKERVVRDGYVPQEEQKVYESRGVVARTNVPLCPGMDNAEVLAAQNAARDASKGKSAKRNEKKREQKAAEGVTEKMAGLSTGPSKPAAAPKPAAAAAAAPPPPSPTDEDPKARLEKEIRKLKKKMRECEPLSEKVSKGEDALTAPEQEKLGKLPGWQAELDALEAQLASA